MPYEADDVFQCHAELKKERQREERALREIFRLFRPDDNEFEANERRERDDFDIFDATPIYAQDDFAKSLFTQATNPVNRWMELGIDDDDLANFRPVREFLGRRTDRLFQSMAPDVSRFYAQARPWFATLGVAGYGTLYQDEIIGEGIINDLALPIGQIFLGVDAYGRLNRVHRQFPQSGRQFKQRFPKARRLELQDDRRYSVIHAVYPNPDYRRDRHGFGKIGAQYLSCYACEDAKDFREDGIYYELPYHVPMWNERAGRAYPTGPGHNARADAASLQEMERSNQVAGQFAAEPPILTSRESLFTAADIVPNAVLEGGINDAGKRLVDVLERKQEIVISHAQAEQKRQAIKEAFYWSTMQLLQRPQMTAAEFNGFREAELERVAPNLVNVQLGLSSFIARRYAIIERSGGFDDIPPPPELVNRRLTVKYISPLAKAQKMAQARSALNFGKEFATLSAQTGRTDILDKIDFDAIVDVAHDGMIAGTRSLVLDDRQVAALRQQRAQQQQQDVELARTAQAVTIAAEASHAQQAATLSRQRVKAA